MSQQVQHEPRIGVSPALIRKLQKQGAEINKPVPQGQRLSSR